MKIELGGLRQLNVSEDGHISQGLNAEGELSQQIPPGWEKLTVTHCAICKTDAKMWDEGHRDLSLPRVLGHEIVGTYRNQRYVIWPGIACRQCPYCLSNKENLCDEMKIIGFHAHGGFASDVIAPKYNFIPVPDLLPSTMATFAEPAGCIVNAFSKLDLKPNDTLLIYGAGTVGLMAALFATTLGALPLVIEKNETKILKAAGFIEQTGIRVLKNTTQSKFSCILNACADPTAFMSGIAKTAKHAKIVFFSGLQKNMAFESNLLNLIHYKELNVLGAYGLTKQHMTLGLSLVNRHQEALGYLVEAIISPSQVASCFMDVLKGKTYKYVIDFSNLKKDAEITQKIKRSIHPMAQKNTSHNLNLETFSINIPLENQRAKAQQKIDNKTKPLGALGILEEIAIQMCLIQNTLEPKVDNKSLFVFAADHGIAEEGVSAFPQAVTRQMVQNFLDNGAAINVLCRHNAIDLSIIDIGVKGPEDQSPGLIARRVMDGTRNFAVEKAMSLQQAIQAVNTGAQLFRQKNNQAPIHVLGLGEMGIANTTSATAIISAITQTPVKACTGRGTGVDDLGLENKINVIEKALAFHQVNPKDGLDVLTKVGGLEIAGMAGAALAAASSGCVVVLDGLISTAAGLLAFVLNPQVADYFIAGHKSVEIGHTAALTHMGLTPVLDLNLRLGEGTGAALTIDLVDAACKIMTQMASFEQAGVSDGGNLG